MSVCLPVVKQVPSPNYTPTPIAHDKIFMHVMEGGCAGSVAWLCRPEAEASVHLCMSEDGATVYQLVPLQCKAWGQCAFNGQGISLELPGFTAQGLPDARWRAAAIIAAWLCRAYAIPPVWAEGGRGRGISQHHDLGAAGGGHVDCSPIGSSAWLTFMAYVKEAYDALGDGPLPPFALHGLPAPHATELPPPVTPEPSHGGAARSGPGEMIAHATPSGFPLGSISDVQWMLRKVGANPSLGVDGDEGGATHAAIGTFQKAEGLPVTGEMNAATYAALTAAASHAA